MPSYRRLQQYALAISIISIVYNGLEGGLSIGFGAESSSRSLVFFGIQSVIEVVSATLVVWRFRKISRPGDEKGLTLSPQTLRVEKIASISIACLLLLLFFGTEATAIVGLVRHDEPSTSTSSLIISASALAIMILIWLPKRYLARELDSSAMHGEAKCSLACIQMTIVLFVGSLVFRLWKGGWFVDSATSIVLGFLFGWEGFKMLRWALSSSFDGGCCDHGSHPEAQELAEQYQDICDCCSEKQACKQGESCTCGADQNEQCCAPRGADGSPCCTRKYMTRPRQPSQVVPPAGGCCKPSETGDECCSA